MPISKKKILFEDVDVSSVELSIKKRLPIKVNYIANEEDKETGSGWRIIQPVAYGLSKSGNPVIRAYQPYGDTKTKVPHWKIFRLDRFETWNPINKKTNIPSPPMDEYNPDGDKTMSVVYLNADYAGAEKRYNSGGLKKYNQDVHTQKVAQNPYYDLKKNIERSKRLPVPDYVQRNVNSWQTKSNNPMKNWINGASAEEMSRTTDFGDENYSQTDRPVGKYDKQVKTDNGTGITNAQKEAYKNIALNGPVNKGTDKIRQSVNADEENNKETETEN